MGMTKCGWKIVNDSMQTNQNILKLAHRIQKSNDKPWSKNNRLDLYRSTPSILHYIKEGLSLSTIKQISNAENRTTRININRININPNDYYNPVIDYFRKQS